MKYLALKTDYKKFFDRFMGAKAKKWFTDMNYEKRMDFLQQNKIICVRKVERRTSNKKEHEHVYNFSTTGATIFYFIRMHARV